MKFVHLHSYQNDDTIAAIATPPGEGGIAIIRISGRDAVAIAEKIFSGPVRKYKTHTAHFGKILKDTPSFIGKTEKIAIDETLLLIMLAPRSFTGEDIIEIHCHGGVLITRHVFETVLKAGARAALPGEFSFRAFINGKLDLVQAEAIQKLIGAQNNLAMQYAKKQLEGALSEKIRSFQKELVDIAAFLEAWVDFPEEGIEFASIEEIIESLKTTSIKMNQLVQSFHEGQKIYRGISLCLAGSPNVGKSSLMNALLGKERAIVTEIPGTTRDLLEEDLYLGELHFRLIDTAGIRSTEEIVEQEGIRRSKAAMEEADIILFILDITRGITEKEELLLKTAPSSKTLLVWNKIDLPHEPLTYDYKHTVKVSAKNKLGLEDLKKSIENVIWNKGPPSQEEVILSELRHKQALEKAIDSCNSLIKGLQEGFSPEFLASDMRACLQELGTIIGTDVTEDILSAIFSKFCIGK